MSDQQTLSRRDAFRMMGMAGASVALASAMPAAAQNTPAPMPAATPPAKELPQGAGFYRTLVGEFEVTLVSDGQFPLQPYPTFGTNASEAEVNAVLEAAFLSPKNLMGQVNTVLIRKQGGPLTLVDTGCGKLFGPASGFMLKNLANAGVRPEDIELLLLTHLHPDHVGGAVGPDGKLVFPNAKVMTHKTEYDFWNADQQDFSKSGVPEASRGGMVEAAKKFINAVGRGITLYSEETNPIMPGLTAIHTGGHTPGHCTLQFESGDQKLLYVTDLAIQSVIVFKHPEWYVGFDTNRDETAEIRKKLFAQLASDRTLISGAHLPFPALGHVKQIGDNSYEFVPAPWRWA